jgi:maleate isomerase
MSGLPDGPLPHRLDDGAPRRAALGLVVLSADETLEADLRLLLPDPAVRLYHTRIASAPDVSAASLGDMEGRLQAAAALLPASAGLDAIGYACTSAATVLGSARVAERVRAAHPGVPVSDPLCALIAACRTLGVRRLGLVSPYVAEVSDALRRALAEAGVAVAAFASFERAQERAVARIAPDSIRSALERVGRSPDCEAVFASCTKPTRAGGDRGRGAGTRQARARQQHGAGLAPGAPGRAAGPAAGRGPARGASAGGERARRRQAAGWVTSWCPSDGWCRSSEDALLIPADRFKGWVDGV